MAKLTAANRAALPSSDFAFPKTRKFPLNDPNHARNALARAAHEAGHVQQIVRHKVHERYPSIGVSHNASHGKMRGGR